MEDFFWSMWSVDTFSFNVLLVFVVVVAWFLKEVVGSGGLAIMSAPLLIFGGLVSRRLFEITAVPLPLDKESAIAVATGAGAFIAMLVMIVGVYAFSRFSEIRSARRRVLPAFTPDQPKG